MKSLDGTITDTAQFTGSLSSKEQHLTGNINITNEILEGSIVSSNIKNLNGTLVPIGILDGELVPSGEPIDTYEGEYEVTSKAFKNYSLNTHGLKMAYDVVVNKIPFWETSNVSGYTAYIGEE